MNNNTEEKQKNPMPNGKRHYLVTYSQLDERKFPSRRSFGEMIAEEFNKGEGPVKVLHWACSKEPHKNGGHHYHCSVKFNGVKRWMTVRNNIESIYGIKVNFAQSEDHHSYISAFRYVVKEDKEFELSEGHPDLTDAKSPRTNKAIVANKRRSSGKSSASASKKKMFVRLTNQDTAMLIRNKNIKNYTQLLALAEERRAEGLTDLSDYVFNHQERFIRELIDKSWKMAEASTKLAKQKKDRLDILHEFREKPCVCHGEWLSAAKEILELNGIPVDVFTSAVYRNLRLGRGKFRNIMIVGNRNCGKSFILKPLSTIYENIFQNPAMHKYGWVGSQNATIIILQDFRWSSDLIDWGDFLRLLEEDEPVHLPAPRNLYKEDVLISSNVAFFATGKNEIKFKGPYQAKDIEEDKMMDTRWKYFRFHHEFKEEDQKKIPPCGTCFAKFLIE